MSITIINPFLFGATHTIFSQSLTADNDGWANFTLAVVLTHAQLTIPSGTITQIRTTFEGGSSEGYAFTKAYIGNKAGSGDAWDATALSQLLFSGGATGDTGVGGSLVSDWLTFSYAGGGLVIKTFGSDSSKDTMRRAAASGFNYYDKGTGDSAATANDTGFATNANASILVNKIEVRVGG